MYRVEAEATKEHPIIIISSDGDISVCENHKAVRATLDETFGLPEVYLVDCRLATILVRGVEDEG